MAVETEARAAKKSRGIFFGWWTVLFTGLASGIGHGYYAYGFSVFFKDLAAELGISRAVTSFASGIGRLEGGATAPLMGWLADRFGPKWMVFGGICIAGAGLVLMNFISSTMTYILAWGLLVGFGLNIGLTVTVDQALTNWFVRKRGLAMGIKFAMIGVGSIIVVPVTTWLVGIYGWRMTCLIWGIVMFALAPLALVTVKQRRPEHYGLLPDGARVDTKTAGTDVHQTGTDYAARSQETEFSFRQAIRTRTFWIIAIINATGSMLSGGFSIHVIPFLTDMGISTAVAGGLMSMMVFFTIPTRFFGGIVADRIRKRYLQLLLAGAFFLPALGLGAFLLSGSMISVYALLISYGIGSGAITPFEVLTIGRFFGRKAFGAIFGFCMVFQAIASLITPVFAGWIYDTTGNYAIALGVFAILAVVSTVALLFATAPKLPGAGNSCRQSIANPGN